MTGEAPIVSIVIASLTSQQYPFPVEMIVVDNASSDGTPEMIEQCFGGVRLLRNTTNEGFAKANNAGIAASRGDYICLMNSDVIVPAGCLESMYSYIRHQPEVGLLGPRMIAPDGKVARSCMRFPTLRAYLCYSLGLDLLSKETPPFAGFLMRNFTWDRTQEVDVLNGWFLLAPRQAIREVGLLDERFFIYGEDIDWSYRFHKAGWARVYFAGAEALHYGGASSSREPVRFYLEMMRANLQFWRKYHGAGEMFAYSLAIAIHELVRLCAYTVQFAIFRGKRADAHAKIDRSLACLKWLVGARQAAGGRT
jgi:GT2 family glycosyltransferase